jgi:hypothetical protein
MGAWGGVTRKHGCAAFPRRAAVPAFAVPVTHLKSQYDQNATWVGANLVIDGTLARFQLA